MKRRKVDGSSEETTSSDRRSGARSKHWRLIVRNLAFSTTKSDLQNVFSKFGPFSEIVLPPCKDPRYAQSCAGFGFVQFTKAECARRAVSALNGSEINGRKVAVDYAVPKDTFESANCQEEDKANIASDEQEVEAEEESDGDDEDDHSDEQPDSSARESSAPVARRKEDSAVSEGRALFLRNLSFDTTDDKLKEAMSRFGDVVLAIVCRYADSHHSKGSAFVHFAQADHANAALAAVEQEGGLVVDGRQLLVHRAVDRASAQSLVQSRQDRPVRDRRNLQLLRASVVRPGTAAARGMSETDARKRAQLAAAARRKLDNLHMFVSPTRLAVHNLPKTLTDAQLKAICLQACNDVDARVIECRVWRETAADGQLTKSRGFAFVAFTEHAHALKCMQAMNNNPEIFSDEKRPIVEFSIENLAALRLKNARAQKRGKSTANASNTLRVQTEKTKRELAKGGQKPLPAKFGPKIRHAKTRGDAKSSEGKMRGKKRSSSSAKRSTKTKSSSGKRMTKYLALP